MRKLLIFCLVASTALAGERLLGLIQSIDTTKSNLSQNPDGQGNWWDGGFSQPFFIPPQALVTVRCGIDTYVCTDKTSCTANEGLPIPAATLLPSSVGQTKGVMDQQRNPDAGLSSFGGTPIRSAVISVLSTVTDGGYHACQVWERMGNE